MGQTEENNKSTGFLWFASAAIVLVVYVGSIGPFLRLFTLGTIPPKPANTAIRTIYMPILQMAEVPVVGDAIEWYVNAWHPPNDQWDLD